MTGSLIFTFSLYDPRQRAKGAKGWQRQMLGDAVWSRITKRLQATQVTDKRKL